jgi:zinc transport system substrate-binding protein
MSDIVMSDVAMSASRVIDRRASLCCLGLAVLLLACSPAQNDSPAPVAPQESERLVVYTVNYPLLYLAERIGGASIAAFDPIPPDVDPAYWSPEPEQVADYQRADLVLLNGAGYAGWLDRASLLRRKLIDTSAGFRDRLLPLDQTVIHTHGPDGDHSDSGTAFTTWLDPELAVEQARAIAAAFSLAKPSEKASFAKALELLERDLEELDRSLSRVAERLAGAPLIFSHPVYQYLERRYDLNGRSLHWEPDQVPDEAMWRELEALLETHPARLMVWEAAPREETRRRLAALGLTIAIYSPCANRPEAGDWLSVMRSNVAGLESRLLEDVESD